MNYGQNFQTANYRGKISQQPSAYNTVQSQYQGAPKQYQPAGYVQSFYGQNQQQMNPAQAYSGSFQASSQQQFQSPQSFHTAQYQGNQAGHDQYLRADAMQPSSMQAASQYGANRSFTGKFNTNWSSNTAQSQNQYQSPQSFHTAQYQGNQAGHDQYLRADAMQPSSAKGMRSSSNIAGSYAGASSSFGMSPAAGALQNQGAYKQPQSFHTGSYQGNQPGHDQYLRADATRPSGTSF